MHEAKEKWIDSLSLFLRGSLDGFVGGLGLGLVSIRFLPSLLVRVDPTNLHLLPREWEKMESNL